MRHRRPLARRATPQLVEVLRKDLGLNRPVLRALLGNGWAGSFVVILVCRFLRKNRLRTSSETASKTRECWRFLLSAF